MIGPVDRLFLERAVELAERGLFGAAENPRVGCILVRDGEVIGRGWHARTGGLHAEANAIADAGGDVAGATAYVSLEPCCHTGRQPPCTKALIEHGVARVVGAMDDPDPRVAGKGYATLRAGGVAVDTTNLAAALQLNAGYVSRVTRDVPYVRVKLGSSLDGRTGMASGESQWITSAAAREDVQYWRARSSVIVTGVGTVLADDPALSVRDRRFATEGHLRQPLVAVADSRNRTPPCAKVFQGAEVLLFAAERGERVDLGQMLKALAARGCNEVLVEAGPTLAGAFLRDRLWDEAIVYVAPKLLGSTARPLAAIEFDRLADTIGGRVVASDRIGEDVRVILKPDCSS